jgi:hypothetical protein
VTVELRTRPMQRFAYRHRSLLVTNPLGLVTGERAEGFYFHNTRVLSRLVWSVNGKEVTPFATSQVGHGAMLGYAEVPESKELRQSEPFSEVTSGINSREDPYGCDDKQGRAMFERLGGTQIVRDDGHFGDIDQPYESFELLDRLID